MTDLERLDRDGADFRLRGEQVTRLETFVDAAFALDQLRRFYEQMVSAHTAQVVLRRTQPEFIEAPVWDPGGKSITFFSWNAKEKGSGGVQKLMLESGRIEPVPTPSWPGVGSFTWLPDGSGALVTASERDQPPQIWFVPAGATSARKITVLLDLPESADELWESGFRAKLRKHTSLVPSGPAM